MPGLAVLVSDGVCLPEPVHRTDEDAVGDLVGLAAGVEEVPSAELVPEAVTQREKATQRLGVDFATCLYLETDDGAVERFGDEVDLVAVMGPPMAELADVGSPRRLLEELADHERLEQVTELGERRRVATRELVRRDPEQVGGETGVDGGRGNTLI